MLTDRSVKLLGIDCRPMAIKPLLQGIFGFTHILYTTYFASDEVNNIRCGAGDVGSDLVSGIVGFAGKGSAFPDMIFTNNASVGITCMSTRESGRNRIG